MFRTLVSDSGRHYLLYDDNDESEMDLRDSNEWRPGEVLRPDVMPAKPQPDDVRCYYTRFRELVNVCGDYEHKRKLLENAVNGTFVAQEVTHSYFSKSHGGKKANPIDNLEDRVCELEKRRMMEINTLDYWSRRVGFPKMSTPEDVEKCHLNVRADTVILLDYLQYADFRKRLRYRIDKYAGKGELKSITELVSEVLASYKKKKRPNGSS